MTDLPFKRDDYDSTAAFHDALWHGGFYKELADLVNSSSSALVQAIFGVNAKPSRRRLNPTTGLSGKRVTELHYALAFANLMDTIPNTFVTIAWSTVDIVEHEAVGRHRRHFMDLMKHWLSNKGASLAWFWVDEMGKHLGRHTHILVHVPWSLESAFHSWATKALKTVTGRPPVVDGVGPGGRRVTTLHVGRNMRRSTDGQWR